MITQKEYFELIKKYVSAEETVIGEFSGHINKEMKELANEARKMGEKLSGKYKEQLEKFIEEAFEFYLEDED